MNNANHETGFGRNIAANWSAFLFAVCVSFFLTPVIVRNLGNEAYGVWVLLGSLVGYLGLLDFGVRGAVTRYIAQHHAADSSEESERTVSAGVALFGSFGVLAVICAGIFAILAPLAFKIPENLVRDARIIIVIGGVNVGVALMGGVFGGVVAGLQRFDVGSGINIVTTAIRAALIVLALKRGYGLIALALIQLLSSILEGGVAWLATRRLYPQLKVNFRGVLRPYMRRLLSFGVFSSLIHVCGTLIYYSDSVVIAAFLPIGALTFYAIAASLCTYARQVVSAISTIMTPRVSALSAAGGGGVERAVLGAARIATITTAPIVITFWLRGESFINLWMGGDFGPVSGEILRLLGVVVVVGGVRSIIVATIMGLNRHRLLVPVLAIEAVANIGLSIALVRPLGLVGVALGTVVPSVIVTLGVLPALLRRTTGIAVGKIWRNGWVLPAVACVPFGLGTLLLEQYYPAKSLLVFFGQVAGLLPLVLAALMLVCLNGRERGEMWTGIRSWMHG